MKRLSINGILQSVFLLFFVEEYGMNTLHEAPLVAVKNSDREFLQVYDNGWKYIWMDVFGEIGKELKTMENNNNVTGFVKTKVVKSGAKS